ncbi:hypothetical protein Scani_30720 [Streptomyces caniferus]|uniref:Uncharacterized protein n=1 Tax=Streptomyces caniferus TaxID=285557 RepID=A0A640S7N0_9ACTN|nr:hypothetical protein Scani_30720 [Streptomyces caniferus]
MLRRQPDEDERGLVPFPPHQAAALDAQVDQCDVDDEHVRGPHHPERPLRDVHLVRRVFRGPVGAGVRRTGVRRARVRAVRAVRRTPGAPAEAAAKAPSEATAPEPVAAGAVTAVAAVVIVLTLALTRMVAQLCPEPQGDRTADGERHEERLTELM